MTDFYEEKHTLLIIIATLKNAFKTIRKQIWF